VTIALIGCKWYGLRFAPPDEIQPAKKWGLEIREDATEAQKSRLRTLTGQAGKQRSQRVVGL